VLATANGFHQSHEFGLRLALRALDGLIFGDALTGARIGASFVFQFP